MNCVLYARVSTDRQADKELSIPAQLAAMRQYASQHGWIIIQEFIEAGMSARTSERPELRALLARCRDFKAGIGAVIVHKVDRLARNLADHVTIKTLLKESGVTLASVVENLDASTSGQLVEHIMASLAEFYSANLSEEVKKGMRQKVRSGGWPHCPPLGYRLLPSPSGSGTVVSVDPTTGPLVRWAFELASHSETSLDAIAQVLAGRGLLRKDGRPLMAWRLSRILRNPFYIGVLHWGDETHKGVHEPLVSEIVFAQVQESRNVRARRLQPAPAGLLLRGIVMCDTCRRRVSATRSGPRVYYHCLRGRAASSRCSALYCNAVRAHQDLERLYRSIPMSSAGRSEVQRMIRREVVKDESSIRRQRRLLVERRGAIDARELLMTDRFAARLIEAAAFDLAIGKLRADRMALARQIKQLQRSTSEPILSEQKLLWDVHSVLPVQMQRALLSLVFLELRLGPSGIVQYRLHEQFHRLLPIRHSRVA